MFRRKRRLTPVSSLALEFSAFAVFAMLLLFTSLAQAQSLNSAAQPTDSPPATLTPFTSPTSPVSATPEPYYYIYPVGPLDFEKITATPTPTVFGVTPYPTWVYNSPTPEPTSTPEPTATPAPTATPIPTATRVPRPGGAYSPLGPATISRQVFINWVNEFPRSAARGEAGSMYDALVSTGTDPAIFAGFALHESTVASAGSSVPNRNIVNISCMYSPCAGRWQIFPSFAAGTRAWGNLMHRYADGSICGRPKVTLDEVLYCYAPTFENPTASYIYQVKNLADRLRNR